MDTNLYRVAVCLSGQLRYWEHCVENIKTHYESNQTFIDGRNIVVDYFIHCWDTNTWYEPKTNHGEFVENATTIEDITNIQKEYQPKGFKVNSYTDHDLRGKWARLFCSFAQSLLLKRNYEIENNFEYDMVIKARPDVIYDLSAPFKYSQLSPLVSYVGHIGRFPSEFNFNNFDDVLFFGDSPTMDLMAGIYQTHPVLEKTINNLHEEDIPIFYCLGPGCLLYEHCIRLNIRVGIYGHINYAVMRSTMVSSGLSIENSFQELRKISEDWYNFNI